MTRAIRLLAWSGLLGLLLCIAGPLAAQPPKPNKKVLRFADQNIFRTTSTPHMSPDGAYIAYTVAPAEGDGEAIVRHVSSGKEFRFPRGGGTASGSAKFTPDGKRVLLSLSPTKAATEKAKAAKIKAEDMTQSRMAVVELASGKIVDEFPQSGGFEVGGELAGFVVYRKPSKTGSENGGGKAAPPMGGTGRGKGGGKFAGKGKAAGGAPTQRDAYGSDLLIRDLTTKAERTIADVAEFNLTRDGKLLVYTVASRKEETNGVYALDPRCSRRADAVKCGPGRYSDLTWDEKQSRLAFLYDDSTVPDPNIAPKPRIAGEKAPTATPAPTPATVTPPPPPKYRVYVWDRGSRPVVSSANFLRFNLTGGASIFSAALTINPLAVVDPDEVLGPTSPGMPSGWTLNGGGLAFSVDGKKLFVNTAPKRESARPAASPARPDDFELDIWHWKDERLQPMQKLQAAADRGRSYSGVVLLDSREFHQLSDETITVSRPLAASEWAIGTDDRKYRHATGYGLPLSDYAAVNLRTGEKKAILPGFGGYSTPSPNLAPNGKHLAAFDGKDWFTLSIPQGKKTNLTAKLKVKFIDENDDHPGTPRPAGQAQWTTDGKFLLINDRYDIWKLAADGSSAENLTKIGRKQQIRFSILRVQVQDEAERGSGVDLAKPQLLGAENLHTRDSGFFRLEPGAKEPRLLVMGPRKYGTPIKAPKADLYLLTVQTFSHYPDYFATGPDFHELKRVTDINPRMKEFNWGKAELVHYKSADGVSLSGVLVKPENFDPSKKYPMVVYIYERLSQNLHNFVPPRAGTSINATFYASNGYLVFMPDIAYTVGSPGQSALKCVLPAIQAVCDQGFVDEKAIGIQGHSWGGYQIAYMVTQTNRFTAAIAGAPVSNMVSAYGGIRWGTGLTRQFQYEWTQSRIGAKLWDAPMKYLENSPIFLADRVHTPLMILHNDQDDAVPWYQGIEYYLALRRLEKECYLLNYNGQPHGLRSQPAARDYTVRMFQFFEHHLKGKAAPSWMAKGVPYLDRDKDREEIRKLLGPEKK